MESVIWVNQHVSMQYSIGTIALQQFVYEDPREHASPKPFVGYKLGHAVCLRVQLDSIDLPQHMTARSKHSEIERNPCTMYSTCTHLN